MEFNSFGPAVGRLGSDSSRGAKLRQSRSRGGWDPPSPPHFNHCSVQNTSSHSWLLFHGATCTILAFQHQILGHNLVSFSPWIANEMQTSPTAIICLTMANVWHHSDDIVTLIPRMSWLYALLTQEKQYHTKITTSVSAQWPLMPSKRQANNTGTAAYATKPVPHIL